MKITNTKTASNCYTDITFLLNKFKFSLRKKPETVYFKFYQYKFINIKVHCLFQCKESF